MGTPDPMAAQRAVTPIVPRVTQTEAAGAAHQGGGIERAPNEADAQHLQIILLAPSKGRKAIHPPASGS